MTTLQCLPDLDWSRMMLPCDDGYDTGMLLDLISEASSVETTETTSAVATQQAPRKSEAFFDAQVGLMSALDHGPFEQTFRPAELEHPNIPIASKYLSAWPACFAQFQQLVDTVTVYSNPQQAAYPQWSYGSSSFSSGKDFSQIHVTADNAMGMAQGLVLELANHKLRLLEKRISGLQDTFSPRNEPDFRSPFYPGRTVCASEAIARQYAFQHVVHLNLQMLEFTKTKRERRLVLMLLARNVYRLEEGQTHLVNTRSRQVINTSFSQALKQTSGTLLTISTDRLREL